MQQLLTTPAAAAAELNKQYHFLTAAQYDRIRALEEEGRATEAAKLASDLLAQAQLDRLEEIREKAGFVERAWIAVKNAALQAWEDMKQLGAPDTTARDLKFRYERDCEAAERSIEGPATRGT